MTRQDLHYIGQSNRATTTERFARHVSSGKVEFFHAASIEFVMGRRDGPFIWDVTGEPRLIDCHCNGGVFNLGHRHPEIARTLIDSVQELDIGNHHLISEQRAALAAKLAESMPGDITYTVFGVSGGEAIDLAIKVARGYTRRPKVISAQGGYHGHTGLALAAGDEKYRAPFGPVSPGFVQVPFNDVPALEKALDDETAAVLFETIPATYGMPVPDRDFFANARGPVRSTRRAAHRRRGADRAGPHRPVVGHRAFRRRAGHHRDRQGLIGRPLSDVGHVFPREI